MRLRLAAAAVGLLWSAAAPAQTPMGAAYGVVWPPATWNAWSATKQDYPVPNATTSAPGIVMPDGVTITICGPNGKICAAASGQYALSTKTTNYNIQATDNGIWFDNRGATNEVDLLLPAAVNGLHYCFTVATAQTFKVKTLSGAAVAIGSINSASGGNILSVTPLSSICVHAESGNLQQWIADQGPVGHWQVN